jgi:hypothetical protein
MCGKDPERKRAERKVLKGGEHSKKKKCRFVTAHECRSTGTDEESWQIWRECGFLQGLLLFCFYGVGDHMFSCSVSLNYIQSPWRVLFVFWSYWGLSSGLYTCQSRALPLEPHFEPVLFALGYFSDRASFFAQGWPQTTFLLSVAFLMTRCVPP